jgi:hypothetical protein
VVCKRAMRLCIDGTNPFARVDVNSGNAIPTGPPCNGKA